MDTKDVERAVEVMLDDAGLTLSPAELARYVDSFPAQRAAVAALYALDLEPVQPAIGFDPTAV